MRVCDFIRVCPRFKRKTARAINIKLDTHYTLWQSLACIDPEVKKVKGQGHTDVKTVTVARSEVCC